MLDLHEGLRAEHVEQHLSDLKALVQVVTLVNRSLNLDEVLQASLEGIQRVVDGRFGCVLLIQPGTRTIQLARATGFSPLLLESLQSLTLNSAIGDSTTNHLSVIAALTESVRQVFQAHRIASFAAIPLTARGRAVGVMVVQTNSSKVLWPSTTDLLLSIGEQVGMAIENARLHATVRESEEWHRAFIENSPDGFWESDGTGKITFVNEAACQILGATRAEILGARSAEFFENTEATRIQREDLFRSGIIVNQSCLARTKNGETKTLSVTTRLVRLAHGELRYQSTFRDVTVKQHLLDVLSHRNQELDTLNRIADIFSRPLEITRALDQVCEQIASLTGMEAVVLFGHKEGRSTLNLLAHYGVGEEILQQLHQFHLEHRVIHQVLVERVPFLLDDGGPGPGLEVQAAHMAGYRAGIAVPVESHGVSIGALLVASRSRTRYEPSDVALLVNIGQRIGMAMENAELYAQMQRRVEELDGLAQLSAECISSLDPQDRTKLAVKWTQRLLHVQACSVRLLDGGDAQLGAVLGNRVGASLPHQVPLTEETRSIVEKGIPQIIVDAASDPQIDPSLRAYLLEHGQRALLSVSMRAPDRAIGLLSVARAEPHEWSQREIDLLQTIANQVAISIANAQLFQRVLSEQRKVQAIFDSGLSGLYATDVEGRITMFNRAAERITGWMQHEICGRTWAEVFDAVGEGGTRLPLVFEVLSRQDSIYHPEGGKIQTRDGRVIPLAEAAAPLLNDDGTLAGAVGAFWDLSREKEVEQNREEFLRMIAHQMRNPLTAMLSALSMLEKSKLSSEERASLWAVVKNEGQHLIKFSEQFLDLEHNQSAPLVECEPTPIVPLIRQAVRIFRVAHPQYRFRVSSVRPAPIVFADPERAENVLRNLLDNAVIYSPIKSLVQILVEAREDGRIDIIVHDRGPGIPTSEQKRVFEPFYRVARPEGQRVYGHGLGLYIARKLAREMGGDVEIESDGKHGCRFHFSLRSSP